MYVALPKTKFTESSLVFKIFACSVLIGVCMHVVYKTVREKERKKVER